jgi:hypothetical protein
MRIWDVPPRMLCRNHLLGEHRELHALWTILTQDRKGYRRHPETLRWEGKTKALYLRHAQLVLEMKSRGYNHQSPLDRNFAKGSGMQKEFVDSIPKQMKLLMAKPCDCPVDKKRQGRR